MPRRTVLIGISVAVLLLPGLAACDRARPSAAARPEPVSTAIVPYSTTPIYTEPIVGKGLVERWGEQRVDTMLGELVAYVRAETLKIERLRPKPEYTAADFVTLSRPMTTNLLIEFAEAVRSALQGDESDAAAVRALALWNVGGDGFTFAPTGPYVVDENIGAVLMLDPRSHGVRVTVAYSAGLRMLKDGVPHLRLVTKQLFVKVMMVDEDGWKFDHFDGHTTIGAARLEQA